jgi:ribosomal protein L11 methyltransferase
MNYLEISFTTHKKNIDLVSDFLTEQGALAITLHDAKDTPIFEPTVNKTPFWESTLIIGLFQKTPPETFTQKLLEHNITLQNYSVKILENKNWIKETQAQFNAMKFGERLWICPSWDTPEPIDSNAVLVQLDPGLAFGTGTHATTALCLKWLERHMNANLNVMDYGCGSGILGVSAIQLGAQNVLAVDLDPQALTSTKNNAKHNHITPPQLTTYLPKQVPSNTTVDIIVANILSEPLIQLKPIFIHYLKPGGALVLSGLLERQVEAILEKYQPEFSHYTVQTQSGWALVWFHGNT